MNIINSRNFGDIFNKLLIYLLIIYTFFMLGRSIWKNYQLKKETLRIQGEIDKITQQNKDLNNLILYYQSDSFREVEARKKLSLKKEGEKVVNFPLKQSADFQSEVQSQQQNIAPVNKKEPSQANWQFWWDYFVK